MVLCLWAEGHSRWHDYPFVFLHKGGFFLVGGIWIAQGRTKKKTYSPIVVLLVVVLATVVVVVVVVLVVVVA